MKLTKSQLKQIIKEEIEEAMLEAGAPPWHAVGKSPEDPRMVVKPGCKRSEREALEMCADHPTDECVTANMECDEPGTAPHEPTGAQQSPWKARRSDRKDPWRNHPAYGLKGLPGEDLTARELYRGLEETGRPMGRTPWEGKSQLKQIIKEEIEDALAETRWGTSKPSVPKKRWCVKYKVGGEDKYKEVSADTDPLARAAAKKSARDDGGTVLDGDIESTRELDSGQKCGA